MSEPYLSIVIPAYNEEKRLPRTLERLFAYLPGIGKPYEIVIVDDGSRDGTVEMLRAYQLKHPELRVLSDGTNRGRGGAVKLGVAQARGQLVLETDSDGSVADEAIGRFVSAFEADAGLHAVFGSRELPDSKIVLAQPFLRVFLGYGFLYLARLLFWMWDITDFTLGFKMFRADAAKDIFQHQYDQYFVAEAELIFVTRVRGYRCIELPVAWTDDKDSRIRVVRDVSRSLVGLVKILMRFVSGTYAR